MDVSYYTGEYIQDRYRIMTSPGTSTDSSELAT